MEMHAHEPRVLAVTGGIQEVADVRCPWLCLNRNPEFVKDRERLQQMDRHGALDPAEVNAFARRWGLLLPDDK
jgi:transcriptional regulator